MLCSRTGVCVMIGVVMVAALSFYGMVWFYLHSLHLKSCSHGPTAPTLQVAFCSTPSHCCQPTQLTHEAWTCKPLGRLPPRSACTATTEPLDNTMQQLGSWTLTLHRYGLDRPQQQQQQQPGHRHRLPLQAWQHHSLAHWCRDWCRC